MLIISLGARVTSPFIHSKSFSCWFTCLSSPFNLICFQTFQLIWINILTRTKSEISMKLLFIQLFSSRPIHPGITKLKVSFSVFIISFLKFSIFLLSSDTFLIFLSTISHEDKVASTLKAIKMIYSCFKIMKVFLSSVLNACDFIKNSRKLVFASFFFISFESNEKSSKYTSENKWKRAGKTKLMSLIPFTLNINYESKFFFRCDIFMTTLQPCIIKLLLSEQQVKRAGVKTHLFSRKYLR